MGMPFLVQHKCAVGSLHLEIEGRKLACTDRSECPLQSGLQVMKAITIPPQTELMLRCRFATPNFPQQGLVKGVSPQLLIATSLNEPAEDALSQNNNTLGSTVQLPAGLIIGQYTALDGMDVKASEKP